MRTLIALSALPLFLTACAGDTYADGPTDPVGAAETVTHTVEADAVTVTETVTQTVTQEPTTGQPTTEEPTDEESTAGGEPDFGEREVSSRGYLIKEIGQPAGIGDEDTGETTVTFTLTDVDTDFQCTTDSMMAQPPQNGNYVAFTWEVETGSPEALTDVFFDASFTLSEWDMVVLDTDGKRLNDIRGNAMSCIDAADALPTSIGPRQTASGLVVLDLSVTEGTLLIEGTNWGFEGAGGWEWNF